MIDLEGLINISCIITVASILLIFYIPPKYKSYGAILTIVLNVIITSIPALKSLAGEPVKIIYEAGGFLPGIPVLIDRLSAWFILIINFTCLTGVLFGSGYLKSYTETGSKLTLHWILFILFHLSMVWVCMLQNGFAFLVAWEVMSVSSMLLVIFDYNKPETLKAGINYLVQMHISVIFLTIGFIWVNLQTGSFSFEALDSFFGSNSNIWLFLIFFAGFGIKAGFIPLHTWLPHAHPAAPSHISGVMSGVIVKIGIYGILRIISYLKADFILLGEIVMTVSILTGIFGILNAAIRRDFKQMLAYCTIENIGIIGIGIGLGLMGIGEGSSILYYLGFGGALLHVLNHSLFKSLLFYSAGSVYQQTHTRDMNKLGGLVKFMPQTAILFLIGSIAIGGMPPFNGFVSEFILYSGLLEGLKTGTISNISLLVVTLGGLSIIGGISVLTFTKAFGTTFLGIGRSVLKHKPEEVSFMMLLPQYLILLVMITIAFYPQLYLTTIDNVLKGFSNGNLMPASDWSGFSGSIANINLFSLVFVAITAGILIIRTKLIAGKSSVIQPTWGCGYVAPNNRMQYTGKSYSKSLGKLFSFILVEEKKFRELEQGEIFPQSRKYQSYYFDFFENRILNYITHYLVYAANFFKFIQNGRVQSYVWYGIIFMISIFLLTVLNVLK